jgi:hypothetical protein
LTWVSNNCVPESTSGKKPFFPSTATSNHHQYHHHHHEKQF